MNSPTIGITMEESLRRRVERFTANAFEGIATLDDWKAVREERQREFWRCLGLDPRPEPCDPATREYNGFSGQGFRARNIGFQMLPDCWSSAAVYYPDPLPEKPSPAVLYVSGHAKTALMQYQASPIMWARRGYVCLILDTIEQHDNPGEHHGSFMGRLDAWLAMGYTPAGAEAWHALSALEVLRSDPSVDAGRIGITGISGGGACSFFTAVLGGNIRALSTLCGLSTPKDAIVNRRLSTHCDCMYPHNLFGRDLAEYAALLAPRPALFCFGDHDSLFYPEETTAFVERTRRIYRLYGAEENCRLVTHACGHEDHPEFVKATQEWFDLHVAGEPHPVIPKGEIEIPETDICVFHGTPPRPNRVDILPELLCVRSTIPLPRTPGEWPEIRRSALESLPLPRGREEAFLELEKSWNQDEWLHTRHCGAVGGVRIALETRHRKNATKLLLSVAGAGESLLNGWTRVGLAAEIGSFGGFEPRLSGLHCPGHPGSQRPAGAHIPDARVSLMRAMILTGQTPVTMCIEDIRLAVEHLLGLEQLQGVDLYLHGKGETAVAALYAALLDDRVAGVLLEDLPATHAEGVPIPGILRQLEMPHAVGLMAPRRTALLLSGHNNWTWPQRVFARLGCSENFVMSEDRAESIKFLMS
jgi:dienelactone hydrolase